MPRTSAGLLLYRRVGGRLELLIAHPGGPLWANRDAGAWSLPKGEADPGEEDLAQVALREFLEETGHPPPAGPLLPLGEVRQASGKVVRAWAAEGDIDPASVRSNLVEVEWPPRSGRTIRVPEIDRVAWMAPAEARVALNPAQAALVDRLQAVLDALPSG